MSATIRIRAYNVRFGDCILLSVPDNGSTRHVLFDFGNAPGKFSTNEGFDEIAKNIQKTTGGTLDLVVMTHEHLDHMEGFYSERKIFDKMKVRRVWMSIPSQPGYYDTHKKSKKGMAAMQKMLGQFQRTFAARQRELGTSMPELEALLLNNLSNVQRIDYVRGLAEKKKVHYLYRGAKLTGTHDFQNVKFKILAPEEEMSLYYKKAQQLAEGALGFRKSMAPKTRKLTPPSHISTTEFARLRENLQAGEMDTLHHIDKAANNTSLVVLVEAAGKKLLFPGDAEVESWDMMRKKKKLGPVDFLKVAHHGSWNGTPEFDGKSVLETLFPPGQGKNGVVLISTKSDVYGDIHPVPDAKTIELLKKCCKKVVITEDDVPANKVFVDITL